MEGFIHQVLSGIAAIATALVSHYGQFTWSFVIDLMADYGLFLVICLGLYVLMIAGQVSLGHAGLVGLAAYTSAVLVVRWGVPFELALPLVIAVGAASGAVYAYLLALRLGGFYLAVGTFALGEMMINIWLNSDYLGGAMGFVEIPFRATAPVIGLSVAAVIYVVWRIENSRFGHAFRAIRDNEVVAGAMGIDVRRMKLLVWMIGGAIAGLGGALDAHRVTVLQPTDFGIYFSIQILLAVLLGGLGSFWGTVLGAATVSLLPWMITTGDPRDRLMIYGLIIVALMVFRPQGLFSPVRGPARRLALLRRWAASARPEGAPPAQVIPAVVHPAEPPSADASVAAGKSATRSSSVAV
jgi:branched-chain amino acid transport system permease protein